MSPPHYSPRLPPGTFGAIVSMIGIALTVAAHRNTDPDSILVPFKWFGPVLIVGGVVILLLLWFVLGD